MNVASIGAYLPSPNMATYTATKAFVLSFTEAIAVELRDSGVQVLCVCPGVTRTEFQERAHVETGHVPGFVQQTADEVADEAVRAVGHGPVIVNGVLNRDHGERAQVRAARPGDPPRRRPDPPAGVMGVPQPVVVVTGASSGIGEALARRIARDGRDLVLTARRIDLLERLAQELATAHGIRTTAIASDLARPDGPATLVAELERRDLEVDWLVNNAGFGTVGRFDRLPVERELEEIRAQREGAGRPDRPPPARHGARAAGASS